MAPPDFSDPAPAPDYVMVVVGANHGITRMTKEHVGMAIALNVPLFVGAEFGFVQVRPARTLRPLLVLAVELTVFLL